MNPLQKLAQSLPPAPADEVAQRVQDAIGNSAQQTGDLVQQGMDKAAEQFAQMRQNYRLPSADEAGPQIAPRDVNQQDVDRGGMAGAIVGGAIGLQTGVVVGGAGGAIVGAVAGSAAGPEGTVAGAIVGGVAGAAVGGTLGTVAGVAVGMAVGETAGAYAPEVRQATGNAADKIGSPHFSPARAAFEARHLRLGDAIAAPGLRVGGGMRDAADSYEKDNQTDDGRKNIILEGTVIGAVAGGTVGAVAGGITGAVVGGVLLSETGPAGMAGGIVAGGVIGADAGAAVGVVGGAMLGAEIAAGSEGMPTFVPELLRDSALTVELSAMAPGIIVDFGADLSRKTFTKENMTRPENVAGVGGAVAGGMAGGVAGGTAGAVAGGIGGGLIGAAVAGPVGAAAGAGIGAVAGDVIGTALGAAVGAEVGAIVASEAVERHEEKS